MFKLGITWGRVLMWTLFPATEVRVRVRGLRMRPKTLSWVPPLAVATEEAVGGSRSLSRPSLAARRRLMTFEKVLPESTRAEVATLWSMVRGR